MSTPAKKQVITDGVVAKPVRDAIDRLFSDVFSTVAFQTAVVCTYAEAVQIALGDAKHSTQKLLDEYVEAINGLLKPKNVNDLKALLLAFEGELAVYPEVKLTVGGPTFRQVVLPGELQPAEWPKYRYLVLELWKPDTPELKALIDEDRTRARSAVAQSLYRRRLATFCQENRIDEASLNKEVKAEILVKSKTMYEAFLGAIVGRKTNLDDALFELHTPVTVVPEIEASEEDPAA